MYRNLNSDFSKAPHMERQRSIMPINTGRATTANAGDLVPFFWTEALAGGTYDMSTSFVIRMNPSVHPTMSNAFVDWFYFFVPFRIMWDDWKHFFGEPEAYWTPTGSYSVPQLLFPVSSGFSVGSLADHLGLPVGVSGVSSSDWYSVSLFPVLAYCHTWNEWFRSENLQDPVVCPTDTASIGTITGWTVGSPTEVSSPLLSPLHGGRLLKACKPFDVYTAALPSPQRGPEVALPVSVTGSFPVYTGADHSYSTTPLQWALINGTQSSEFMTGLNELYAFHSVDGTLHDKGFKTVAHRQNTIPSSGDLYKDLVPSNLYALANNSVAASLNDLRYAFSLQHLYEDLARHGSRYREILHGIFGVSNPDPTRDIPEYIGGGRAEINMSTVIQSGAKVSNSTPLATAAGYSHTSGSSHSYTYTCLEPGIILGCFTIRQPKQYAQGVNRMWKRKDRFDFYWPEFSAIGEVSALSGEVYFSDDGHNGDVFGYQEAWYEYRHVPYEVTGLFRPGVSGSLASWNYADYYTTRPQLSDEWIEDNSQQNIDRTLAVPSSTAGCQFLVDIALKGSHVLPMPVYSIPGLSRL